MSLRLRLPSVFPDPTRGGHTCFFIQSNLLTPFLVRLVHATGVSFTGGTTDTGLHPSLCVSLPGFSSPLPFSLRVKGVSSEARAGGKARSSGISFLWPLQDRGKAPRFRRYLLGRRGSLRVLRRPRVRPRLRRSLPHRPGLEGQTLGRPLRRRGLSRDGVRRSPTRGKGHRGQGRVEASPPDSGRGRSPPPRTGSGNGSASSP